MIPKAHRFHGHHSLDFTYRRGKTVRGEMIGLRFVKAKSNQERVAVVVAKKVQKSAVARNLIRRRVFEAIREIKKENGLPQLDMIVTIYDDKIIDKDFAWIKSALKQLLQKTENKSA